ncbi:lytic murein transglycosylase [Pengzhenrongella phosphoraccumulans]|uniref:lytic murein transglycosylase n=1 Tax=Pengzhenrongella phosphoraccumulans TaxID=3114394 RepID=UPI00388E009B
MKPIRARSAARPPRDPLPGVVTVVAVLVVALTAGAAARASASPRDEWAPAVPGAIAAVEPSMEPAPGASAALGASVLGASVPGTPALPVRAAAAWVAATSAATGIGSVAVRAYADATLTIATEQPGCRLGWTTLAAIGATESGHGTHGGAVLADDGRPSIPIIGPALDGRPGFAAIRADPDATVWHGDPVWDHAVGPLQFLPSTWRRWGADGDGDRVSDPNDLDDAALAAARYLCAAGTELTTASAWQAAVLSYNHSQEYMATILTVANGYAAASLRGQDGPS